MAEEGERTASGEVIHYNGRQEGARSARSNAVARIRRSQQAVDHGDNAGYMIDAVLG